MNIFSQLGKMECLVMRDSLTKRSRSFHFDTFLV